jgi:SAM-dependent methyltransferase
MDVRDAARLIAPALTHAGVWAELGAGTGTFTRALAGLLGCDGTVYAVERDERSGRTLDALARRANLDEQAVITVVRADFTGPLELPTLDGVLLANALHYVPDEEQAPLLARMARNLTPDGALLIVEYDDRPRSRWVPYPVSLSRLRNVAAAAALGPVKQVGRAASAFGGTMYAAKVGQR